MGSETGIARGHRAGVGVAVRRFLSPVLAPILSRARRLQRNLMPGYRRDALILVRSDIEAEGVFRVGRLRLHRSAFNMAWPPELGVDPRTILDVGSFDAGDAIRFKRRFPRARVVAIEADPNRFAIVQRNAAIFGVEAVHAAVCDRDGVKPWFQAQDHFFGGSSGGQGSLFAHSLEYKRRFPYVTQDQHQIAVPSSRLDTLCGTLGIVDVDLVHVDIEGAEYQALRGLGSIRPKLLYLEAQPFAGWDGVDPGGANGLALALSYRLAASFRTDRLYVRGDLAGA